jgi:membrane-bound serine protease (ClpP class)
MALADAPAALPPGPRPLPEIPHGGQVTIQEIRDTIDLGMTAFIERVARGQKKGDLWVLDINTLGGRVDAAIAIRDTLLRSPARTVCWVNPRAISAGALISLACDVIVVSSGATIGAATPVQIGQGGEMKPVEEKVVSYMRKEMKSTAEAKGRRGDIAEAMVDADLEVPGLDEKGKLLTLDGKQAIAWGIAEGEATSTAELFQFLGRDVPAKLQRPKLSWAESLARFLSDPVVAGILMSLGMLGILVELYNPGHGVSLLVGLICLGVFFFGHHIVKLAGWEEIVLFLVGIALIGYEVFLPGHIVPGVIGMLCVLGALVMALVNLEHVPIDVAWKAGWLTRAFSTVSGAVVLTTLLGWGIAKLLPQTRLGRPLILDAHLSASTGSSSSALDGLVGTLGTAVTELGPVGKILVGDSRHEGVSERGWVAAGARVRIVRVDGRRLVVQKEEEIA